jgi:hypothetical protein
MFLCLLLANIILSKYIVAKFWQNFRKIMSCTMKNIIKVRQLKRLTVATTLHYTSQHMKIFTVTEQSERKMKTFRWSVTLI